MEKMYSIIVLLFILPVCVTQNGQSILSSEFYTNYFTDNDFGNWTITGSSLPSDHFFSQCGTSRIFGGYQKFGGDPNSPTKISRQYSGLIAHYAIRIQAKIYKIDSYNNENIFVMIDNVAEKIYNFQQTNSTQEICGDPFPVVDSINKNYNDSIILVDFTINHNSSIMNLGIETDLNSDKGWWGLREIRVTLMECDKSCMSCTNATSCMSCDPSITGLTLIGAYCQCTVVATIKQLITQCTVMPCVNCVTSCSSGYYYSSITTLCQPCNTACSMCSGPSNTVFPACGPCASGFFRNNPLTDPCYNCLGFCNTCSALNVNACTSCKQGYFLLGTQCLSSCPNGTYSQQNARQCFPCSPSCFTCDGSSGFYCTSCTGALYLTLSTNQCLPSCSPPFFKYNNKCLQECPSGTFQDFLLYICTACLPNCAQCTNSVSCSKCANNFYLLNGQCTFSCPTSYYGSATLGQCIACHPDCLECFGSSSTSCTICSDATKILLNGACYSTCPNGTYSSTCQPCHSSCLNCVGPLDTQCTSCSSPQFLQLSSNRCVQACQTGQIVDKVNFTCQQCPSKMVGYFNQCVACSLTCQDCFGTSFLECQTCDQNSTLYMSTCLKKDASSGNIITSEGKSMNTGSKLLSFIILTGIICFVLQFFFTYKTPMLTVIQFIQILGYMYFLSIGMSEQVQQILAYFYRFNFSTVFIINSQNVKNLPVKIVLMGKTGQYAIDTLVAHIMMLLTVIIMFILKKAKELSRIVLFFYQKLNPYLISYMYRFVILDQVFSLIIYLRYGGIQTALGIISLVVVLLDFVLLGLSLLWKIKPSQSQENRKQYGIFYFNEIKQNQIDSVNIKLNEVQDQNKNEKRTFNLLTLLFYVGKIPFPLAIVYFITNGVYQSIAVLGYSLFFLVMITILPYKRKIYRVLYIIGSAVLVLSSGLFLAVYRNQDNSIALQIIWLIYILFIFIVTVFQFIINYKFFIKIIEYSFLKLYELLNQETQSHSQISNLHQQNSIQQISIKSIQKSQINNIDNVCENQSALKIQQNSKLIKKFDNSQQNIETEKIQGQENKDQVFTDFDKGNNQQKKIIMDQQQNKSEFKNLDESSIFTDLQRKKELSEKEENDQNDIYLDLDL